MGFGDFLFKKDEEVKIPARKPLSEGGSTGGYTIPGVSALNVMTTSSNDYNNQLNELMDKSNSPGPDYYEFSKALEGLLAMPLSEPQKYQVAFATFSAQGVTAQQLITSAEKYLGILDAYNESFQNHLKHDNMSGVTDKRNKIVQLQKDIVDLQTEIQKKTDSINTLNTEASTNEGKLSMEENSFRIALENKKATIVNQINNIKNLLNGTK